MKKLLLLASFGLLSPWNIALAEDTQYLPIGPFGTLNNTDNSLVIPSQKAQDLLNVEISPGGGSVKKRSGYAISNTLTYTTSPVHGMHFFYDSNGNDVAISFHDSVLSASIGGGSIANVFTNGPNGATYQCVDSQGFAYCANTSRTAIIKTNGATSSNLTGFTSTGTLVAVTPERLVQAGFSGSPNDIVFSKANDFTTWTVGGNATDPVSYTITSPGPRITHIVYAFDRIVWFKNTSFGYILIGNQPNHEDWQVVIVDSDLGTLDNTSVFREGILYFRGQDSHLYSFDGSNLKKLTRDIQTTVSMSQVRALNSWTQTSQSDFSLGVSTPTNYLSTSTVSGSVVISTSNSVSYQIDTTSANFAAGTLTNLSTTIANGSLTLSLGSESDKDNIIGAGGSSVGQCSPTFVAQQFTAGSNYYITSVTLILSKLGSPGNYSIQLMADNSNTIGNLLSSGTFNPSSVTGTPAAFNIVFDSGYSIISGTKYWIKFISLGTCSGPSPQLYWERTLGAVSEYQWGGSSYIQSARFDMKTLGKSFNSTGNIVSRVFDVGKTTNTILWNWCEFVPNGSINGQTLTYETQTSSSATGSFTTLVSVSSRAAPTSLVQRFIRYKASFETSNSGVSPQLDDVTMNACFIPSYLSAVKNAPSLTAWESFTASKQDNGGSHTFYIRSSTNPITVASSTLTWTTVTNGATPSISTGTYFQIRDDFSITYTTQIPSLDSFTQSWFEGNASDKSYATYHKDAIWWSIASGAGASGNNKIFYYDMLNDGMTLYDIASNGFYVRNQSLYFGSSTSGYIFKYGSGDNDNNSAINSYWKSKDFVVGAPFQDKEFVSLSFAADAVTNSSMTVTYTLNGSSSTSYAIPLQSNNSYSFIKNNKNLPAGKIGQTFNVQFGNNAADQPYEIFGIQAGYRSKPWRPE